MRDQESVHMTAPLNQQEPVMKAKESQSDEPLVDPTIDRLFELVNAAEDRTSIHIDLDKVLSAAFNASAGESTDRPVPQEASTRSCPPDDPGVESDARAAVSNRTSARLSHRFRRLLGILLRLIRQTGLALKPSRSALFACAAYSLLLMVVVGYNSSIAITFAAFVGGAITAAVAHGAVPILLTVLQAMHLTRARRRLVRDEAQAWRARPPIYDTTPAGACVAELKRMTVTSSDARVMSFSYEYGSVFEESVGELAKEALAEREPALASRFRRGRDLGGDTRGR